jgi:hypothetical protein
LRVGLQVRIVYPLESPTLNIFHMRNSPQPFPIFNSIMFYGA